VVEVRYSVSLPDSFISRLQVALRHLTLLGGSWRYGCCLCMQNPATTNSSNSATPSASVSLSSKSRAIGQLSRNVTTSSEFSTPSNVLSRHNSSAFSRNNSSAFSRSNSDAPLSRLNYVAPSLQVPLSNFNFDSNFSEDDTPTNISVNEVKTPRSGLKTTSTSQHSFGIILQHGSSIFILSAGETTGKMITHTVNQYLSRHYELIIAQRYNPWW